MLRLTTTQTDGDSGNNFDDHLDEDNTITRKRRHSQATQKDSRVHNNDTFDAFGLFVASQLRSLSKRNRVASANLQRAILEICLKSELEN